MESSVLNSKEHLPPADMDSSHDLSSSDASYSSSSEEERTSFIKAARQILEKKLNEKSA